MENHCLTAMKESFTTGKELKIRTTITKEITKTLKNVVVSSIRTKIKTESYPEKSLTKAEEIHSGRQND